MRKFFIPISLLYFLAILPTLTDFCSGAEKDKIGKIHFPPYNSVNVIPMLQGKQLQNGLNPIHTSPTGVRLSAKVNNGKIVDWVVTDKNGRNIPTTMQKKAGEGGKMTCWKCYNDSEGNLQCYQIPCPKFPEGKEPQI